MTTRLVVELTAAIARVELARQLLADEIAMLERLKVAAQQEGGWPPFRKSEKATTP